MAKKPGFEARMAQLEEIVHGLEDGELELDKAVSQYQSGMKLVAELQEHLNKMEKKIEELTANGETKDVDEDSAQ